MPLVTSQEQMEAYVKSEMLEFLETNPDSIYTMMHPRLVRCDYSKRALELVVQTKSWMRNTNDSVHGGITATLLDTVGGMVCRCFVPNNALTSTISLQVSYLDAIPLDTQLQLRATVTRPGRSIVYVRMEAFGMMEKERLYATGTAEFYVKRDMFGAAARAARGASKRETR